MVIENFKIHYSILIETFIALPFCQFPNIILNNLCLVNRIICKREEEAKGPHEAAYEFHLDNHILLDHVCGVLLSDSIFCRDWHRCKRLMHANKEQVCHKTIFLAG